MQKITPCLWFDTQAEEAMKFYTSLFPNSKISNIMYYGEGAPFPAGTVLTGTFELAGFELMALNGGPEFKFTPAISLFVNCTTMEEIEKLWNALVEGGQVLMEFGQYPFSEKYGWLQDKFGVSWQLNLTTAPAQKIAPSLMYVGEQNGKTEEAIHFYTSLFPNSNLLEASRYEAGEDGTLGTLKYSKFTLKGQEFIAMDSSMDHKFNFTHAISFFVKCETQEEIDIFWNKFLEGGQAEDCGWIKDRYGVSWQIVPNVLGEMISDKDPKKSQNVMNAMLQMKKLDIATLKKAYQEE